MARIGVNALYLIPGGTGGGTEIYLRELLTGLAAIDSENEYFVFTNLETGADLVPRQPNFIWKPQAVRAKLRMARILWEQTILPLEAARYRLDVMFNAGFTAPVFAPCPNVTVFYDLRHRLQPEGFRWFDRPFWRFLLWTSARVSKRIITISESARTDFTAIYGVPAERITVVYPGLEPRFFELQRDHTEPFVLCVSALFPHKNHARLIRAFARRQRDFRLVLAGMRNFQAPMLDALIAELGVADSVQLTGWIPREEIFGLYQRAHAFIYPSTFEGFGMPVLEAMAAGIPVACSDIPSLREAAEDAVLRFDPLSED